MTDIALNYSPVAKVNDKNYMFGVPVEEVIWLLGAYHIAKNNESMSMALDKVKVIYRLVNDNGT